jgi:N-acyl-D-aspartate/D-glutamate deacylase
MAQLLRGATVVDGLGGPERRGDVVVEGDTIVAVGESSRADRQDADDVVDLEGLVLAPGFIDSHTHMDAQVIWDPDLTPSSWHGVTTTIWGNCGFSVAPTRPEHREAVIRMLENVEGMSAEVLTEGIDWTFETFPEYLAAIARIPKRCNVGAMIGHSTLRPYVLGDNEPREATADEIATQRRLVLEAMQAGAIGFSSSHHKSHFGEKGLPVASRHSAPDEIVEIAGALRDYGRGVVQFTRGDDFDRRELAELSQSIGRPVLLAAVLTGMHSDMTTIEDIALLRSYGGTVHPCVNSREVIFQLTLIDPFTFVYSLPSFKRVLTVPDADRITIYRDPEWRAVARTEAAASDLWRRRFEKVTIDETSVHHDLVGGPTIAELARQQAKEPIDVLIDLALAEDLRTRFRVVVMNDDPVEVGQLLSDPDTLICLSDAGAHASQLCDADFATNLLRTWWRERGVLSLPEAVRRLTSQPADIFGLRDRGRIAVGSRADLVAFDPDTVGSEGAVRVHDLPCGADRLIRRSVGIETVWVNGVQTYAGGELVEGARPGVVVRPL